MGSELVTSRLPTDNEGRGDEPPPLLHSYGETFNEKCGYYLSIGMTYEQYWDGDCTACKYYREAAEIDQEKRNQDLWLQGLYIYEALCDAAPILNGMSERHKPYPYRTKPYPVTRRGTAKAKVEEKKERLANGKEAMTLWAENFNRKFEEKQGGSEDG